MIEATTHLHNPNGLNRHTHLGVARKESRDKTRPFLLRNIPEGLDPRERDEIITEERILQAKVDSMAYRLDNPAIGLETRPRGGGGFAFLVHPRDLTDIPLQFPFLSPNYLSEPDIRSRFSGIPPFWASKITGLEDQHGRDIKGWVVVSTFIPDEIMNQGRDQLERAKKNIVGAAKLAYMLGADIVGLGAMSAMLSHYGKSIEKELPIKVTTGHSYTSYLIKEVLLESAKRTNQKLTNSTVAVVGAAGSIGSMASRLSLHEVQKLILIDTQMKTKRIAELAQELKETRPSIEIETLAVSGSNDPEYAHLKKADFVISATTAVEPFIKKEWLKPGVIVIDDSAPVNIARGESEAIGGMTLHVVASTPGRLHYNFDFKLAPKSIFPCGAEVAALSVQSKYDHELMAFSGETTKESVRSIGTIARANKFKLAQLQSFGEEKTAEDYARVINTRARIQRNQLQAVV